MAPQSQQQQQQQQAYHHNAQLPRTDLSAIMNSLPPDQLAVLVQAIQSGALTMPPQVAAPISQTPTPTQNNLPPLPPPPPQQQQQPSRVPPFQQEPLRTDKEEGELEEGEEMEDPAPKPRTRSPLRMSKKRSASPKDPYGRSVNRRTSAQHQQTDGNPAKSRRVSEYGSAGGGDVRRTSGPVNRGNSLSSLGAAGEG
ncbi:hypothetical protein KC315_g3524 [Hortaea werneckii]|nr:hypothetical protein KC315_g3524 [Hortaea werneckii]